VQIAISGTTDFGRFGVLSAVLGVTKDDLWLRTTVSLPILVKFSQHLITSSEVEARLQPWHGIPHFLCEVITVLQPHRSTRKCLLAPVSEEVFFQKVQHPQA